MAGSSQRIKGQNTFLDVIVNNEVQDSIGPVTEWGMEFMLEIISQGYIGETTERKDSIFKGFKGNATLHLNTKKAFNIVNAAIENARQRVGHAIINAKATFNFPNGDRVRIIFPDIAIGAIPISFGGTGDYGEMKLEWECSEPRILIV